MSVPLTLVKLSQMAADIPEIHELDINPLLADETGVLALDARVAIRAPATNFAGQTRFAVRPYPTEWERQIVVRDGWTIDVRPMRPEDEPAVVRLLRQVSPEDLRLRFFHSMKEFSHQFVARLTQLDYARAMAFVAIDPETRDIIGVVRLHSDFRYETAEYAILLRSDLKGKGLGWALMQLLIDYARCRRSEVAVRRGAQREHHNAEHVPRHRLRRQEGSEGAGGVAGVARSCRRGRRARG